MILSGKARLAGVIGWPISHSKSPRLHGYWLENMGIDGAYLPLAIEPDNFEDALRGLMYSGFSGVNVTVPHKEAALNFCDEVDPLAKRIGAVNTIVFKDGRSYGSNTDAFGFIENLKQGTENIDFSLDFSGAKTIVLGAGGASRGVIVALQDAGVQNIILVNRTRERAEVLAADLSSGADGMITVADWDDRNDVLNDCDLLVNTTSLGMAGQPPLELSLDKLPKSCVVTDIVYAPLITPLLGMAEENGNKTVDGLGMLLHQARPGFEAWFGGKPKVTEDLRTFVLGKRDNS
ncbi:shikimate dehydrogenase [Kiloniella spongiae]|uniref:Shikimate dehydrogenase (NADP(+)) n=1 Tax=Kiloniella spongiae TaxID=1489064 RepID=A0A0H2ME80_9PROT|nr:shikimate dehydrogenase [Kiloniella spongiae]KLN60874.1 shikimate dehydrogenase [Kiloniella spongiae]